MVAEKLRAHLNMTKNLATTIRRRRYETHFFVYFLDVLVCFRKFFKYFFFLIPSNFRRIFVSKYSSSCVDGPLEEIPDNFWLPRIKKINMNMNGVPRYHI